MILPQSQRFKSCWKNCYSSVFPTFCSSTSSLSRCLFSLSPGNLPLNSSLAGSLSGGVRRISAAVCLQIKKKKKNTWRWQRCRFHVRRTERRKVAALIMFPTGRHNYKRFVAPWKELYWKKKNNKIKRIRVKLPTFRNSIRAPTWRWSVGWMEATRAAFFIPFKSKGLFGLQYHSIN